MFRAGDVIVLGVLIALGADRWNQGREDRAAGSDYLVRLRAELRADSGRISGERMEELAAVEGGLVLLDVVEGAESDSSSRGLYFSCARGAPLPYPGGSTFQEILGTGSLDLLPEGARQVLFDYYGFVAAQSLRMEDVRRLGWTPLSEAAFETGAWLPRDRLPDAEWLERFRDYPNIAGVVSKCVGWHQTTSTMLRQWEGRVGEVLAVLDGH